MEAGRHTDVPGFSAIVFRRLSTQITGGGSVWEESRNIFPALDGTPREHRLDWRFPSGATVGFSHLQYAKDVQTHLSKQYALIIFDQLEQFEESQFWDMLGRNRSTCGVRPYIRGAANPDPDSFLYANGQGLIAWWIGSDGFPIPERSGVIRWFVRSGDDLVWGDSKEDVQRRAPEVCKKDPEAPLSITFIPAKLEDNPALLAKDPQYRGKLLAMQRVQRERMLLGNWKIKPSAGLFFRRSFFEFIDAAPVDVVARVRAWDKAATKPSQSNPDPDWTAGVKYSKLKDGRFCIEHAVLIREGPFGVEKTIKNTAESDGARVKVGSWQDPGAAGKADAKRTVSMLPKFPVKTVVASQNKVTYAEPVSSQAEAGNILIVRGSWNEAFLNMLEGFPDAAHDDAVDALSLAHLLCDNSDLESLRRRAKW